jgi:outer membrane receptor protein involved in Fe transport
MNCNAAWCEGQRTVSKVKPPAWILFVPVLVTGWGETLAQSTESARVLEEIVVTATRKEQQLSDVPISVAAYTRGSLDQQGVRNIDDVARLTPGLSFTRDDERNGAASTISIRGIASTAGSSTTGIYIDDTPIQIRTVGFSAFNAYPVVFDLERIEVLRGPQGTLFGAGSEGGTVRFITPRPELDAVHGYSRNEFGSIDGGASSYETSMAINLPLVEDSAAVRLAGYYRRDGGYIDRVDYMTGEVVDKNANSQETIVGSASFLWQATPVLSIAPSVFYQDVSVDDGGFYWETLSDGDDDLNNGNALANTSDDDFVLPSLRIAYEGERIEVISNTSYFYRDQEAINDYTVFEAALWTGNPFYAEGTFAPASQFNKQKNFTQELRIQSTSDDSPLSWVAGVFYQRNVQEARQFVQNTFLPEQFLAITGVPFEAVFGQGLADGRYTFVLDEARSIDKQLAAFGQVDYRLTDRVTLTAGVRVAKTDLSAAADFRGPVVGPPVSDRGSQEETPVTPKFGISYALDDGGILYASAAKGYRIGGYNPAIGVPCGVSQTGEPIPGTPLGNIGLANRPPLFESDSVWSYEVGAKKDFSGRLQLNASGFYIDWTDIQQQIFLGCGFNFVDNLGSATSRGFDLQFQLEATDQLTFGGSIGYTKATFDETVLGGPAAPLNIVTEDDHIPLHPWQIAVNGQYQFNVARHDAYARFDYQYLSEQDSLVAGRNTENGGADPTLPPRSSYSNLSLRAGVLVKALDVSVFVNNVTNESPLLVRQRDTTSSPLYRGSTLRPRTFGLTVSAIF